jgi:hypothetical protein
MVSESSLGYTWTRCLESGCDAPAVTLYNWCASGVGTEGQDITVFMDRRNCTNGHYFDVEVFEEDDAAPSGLR